MYHFSERIFDIGALMEALENTQAERIVLFGAGGWGEALFDELTKRHISFPVVFADNDRTKHGLKLKDRPIVSPAEIDHDLDIVVITTISAGEKLSGQLEGLGFSRNENYFEVMHNLNPSYSFHVLDFYMRFVGSFEGLDILHIGPGGHLGVEMLLFLMGAKSVYSIEYDSFNLRYPDVTSARTFYEDFTNAAIDRGYEDPRERGLLKLENGRMVIDSNSIRLLYPCSVTALPFSDKSFDLILHHAVFEHIPAPEEGYKEIFRTLRPGGITVGLVDPQDHRTFSSFSNYHPMKFLEYSREEWYEISRNINFHNQITTPEHKEMIASCGFKVLRWEPMMEMDITDVMWERFNQKIKKFDRKDLEILRFAFSAIRPG